MVVTSDVDESLRTGLVQIRGSLSGDTGGLSVSVEIIDPNGATVLRQLHPAKSAVELSPAVDGISLWWPAGMVRQVLYQLRIVLLNAAGQWMQREDRTIGFRRVRWSLNKDAPAGAVSAGESRGAAE